MSIGRSIVSRVIGVALIASLFVGLVPGSASAITERKIRNRLYEKVNNTRDRHDVRTLKRNDKTQTWARDHARWLENHPLAGLVHDSDTELWKEVPGDAEYRSENLAWNSSSSMDGIVGKLHKMLMDSPGHRANILEPRVTHFGFGVIKKKVAGLTQVWVVQRFVDRR